MDYQYEILEALYSKDVINEDLYEKCQPKYISGLPGNLRSTDLDELHERALAIGRELRYRADTIA